MARRFKFSLATTTTCVLLALGMARASVWQWQRHIEKQGLIATLKKTLELEPVELQAIADSPLLDSALQWRRVSFSGTYDFEHEVIVRRNRGAQDRAGVHVITPLKLEGSERYVLVDRGFLPLGREGRDFRKRYQTPLQGTAYGLVKSTMVPKLPKALAFLEPQDPPVGPGKPRNDLWIRVDIQKIRQQLPYPVLPIYLESMENPNDPLLASQIVKEGAAGRNDVLALTGQKQVENFDMRSPEAQYPIPLFDTTPPPDIHLGYVYEWAFMALLTLAIGFIAQLKRTPRDQ
jgi:surfeit locus 1 family protein